MTSTLRRTAAVVATVSAGLAVAAPSAQAAQAAPAKSQITVRASDSEVRPGEQFVLRGRMTSLDSPVADATVRVQTFRAGGWHRLPGAMVSTGSDGRYRVRVVLSSGGDRDLQVVGDPAGAKVRVARATTVVRVLG